VSRVQRIADFLALKRNASLLLETIWFWWFIYRLRPAAPGDQV
jgi:hypothetical protein